MEPHPLSKVVDDVYDMLRKGKEISDSEVEELAKGIAEDIRKQVQRPTEEEKDRTYIWPSQLGTPCDRQIWYHHQKDIKPIPPFPWTIVKFMTGDIYERIWLAMIEWTGKHEVTGKQEYVEWKDKDGNILLRGKQDAQVDGVKIELKAMAPMSYAHVKEGGILESDPFGYIPQLASYVEEDAEEKSGAILAMDRLLGHAHILHIPAHNMPQIRDRVEHLTEVLKSKTEPDRYFEAVDDGYKPKDGPFKPNGNKLLGLNCSYCPFRYHCWRDANDGQGLRTFKSSKGPVYFTHVVKEPRMMEISNVEGN